MIFEHILYVPWHARVEIFTYLLSLFHILMWWRDFFSPSFHLFLVQQVNPGHCSCHLLPARALTGSVLSWLNILKHFKKDLRKLVLEISGMDLPCKVKLCPRMKLLLFIILSEHSLSSFFKSSPLAIKMMNFLYEAFCRFGWISMCCMWASVWKVLLITNEHCIMCMTALREHTIAKLLALQTSSSEAFNL